MSDLAWQYLTVNFPLAPLTLQKNGSDYEQAVVAQRYYVFISQQHLSDAMAKTTLQGITLFIDSDAAGAVPGGVLPASAILAYVLKQIPASVYPTAQSFAVDDFGSIVLSMTHWPPSSRGDVPTPLNTGATSARIISLDYDLAQYGNHTIASASLPLRDQAGQPLFDASQGLVIPIAVFGFLGAQYARIGAMFTGD
jgi:hypothetical protein